jgi:hypothetical protein
LCGNKKWQTVDLAHNTADDDQDVTRRKRSHDQSSNQAELIVLSTIVSIVPGPMEQLNREATLF